MSLMKSSRNEVASLLKDLREERGESLRAAAKGIGVDPGHLARLESGQKPISEPLSSRVSDYYNVDQDILFAAVGRLPSDVVRILLEHPEELSRLRSRYSTNET